ncbi:protein CFAP20DC [Diretmus argenteus]
MFKNYYQGGDVVEIFSAQGKDPVAKWKLHGGSSAIRREYNKEVKGFVYCLEGSSQTVKMQMPEDGKMALGLLQRFLVLQVNVPEYKDFSIELVITDLGHLKKRLYLSTAHKEFFSTHLHARIPFVGLKHNTWCNLCIDLVSFTSELFKSAGILKLDGITLSASCRLRRIFTMKTEPTGISDDGVLPGGAGLADVIPPRCQFLPNVYHITQMLNMEKVRQADMRTGLVSSDCAPDQSATARSASSRKKRFQVSSHTAFGSRVSGPPPQTGPSSSARTIEKGTSESIVDQSDKLSHGEPSPHERKIGFELIDELSCSPAKESAIAAMKPVESLSCRHRPSHSSDLQVRSSLEESDEGPEPQLIVGEEVFMFSSVPHSAKRGQGHGDHETMTDKDKKTSDNQVQRNRGRCDGAQPEDDFIGSESDEDEIDTKYLHQRASIDCIPTTPRSPVPTLDVHLNIQPDGDSTDQTLSRGLSPRTTDMHTHSPSSRRADPAGMIPTRCLSPAGNREAHKFGGPGVESQDLDQNCSASLCRRFLQEVILEDSREHKEDEDRRQEHVDSRGCELHLLGSLRMQGDCEEELRMLASLKREQEEDDRGASGLSASQIHQCNVSLSMSSDDTSTWTHIPMPTNQGYHYQKEMNPLLHSNPREWMDVLSPPIFPPSQHGRSDNTQHRHRNLIRGQEAKVNEEENEDEYLNLLYDPCLNCYFDPQTGKYYELGCVLSPWLFSLYTNHLTSHHSSVSISKYADDTTITGLITNNNEDHYHSDHLTLSDIIAVGGASSAAPSPQVEIKLHPGIIASVIFVTLTAVFAAVLIIRKYCFPVNEATYRYSLLRRLEDQGPPATEEDNDRGEESDEEQI